MTQNSTPNYPDFTLYEVEEVTGGKNRWNRLGAGWKTKDGRGVSLRLNTHPIGRDIVLLPYQPQKDEEATDQP